MWLGECVGCEHLAVRHRVLPTRRWSMVPCVRRIHSTLEWAFAIGARLTQPRAISSIARA